MKWALLALGLVAGVSVASESMQRPLRRDLLVAAAASLSGVAPHLTQALHDATGLDVRFNFAGSNTLARQIAEGARVDAFISADASQMDVVERAGRVVPGTRIPIVRNQLVVIVPELVNAPFAPEDLASPTVRLIVMGDPSAVPAGVYGRRWLEMIRLWDAIETKVVPLPSSPAVMAALREGRGDAGVVYASDAKTANVRPTYLVPLHDAPEIVYPAAAISGGRIPLARQMLDFLRTPVAQRIFESAGFRPATVR